MKVALVHYWLVRMGGGEKVLEALCRMFPEADIYTHVYDREGVSEAIRGRRVRETFIGRLPGARRHYRSYLPLMPFALRRLDLSAYDLVISLESGPAKGVVTSPRSLHVCYCLTPMRYVWDMYDAYRSAAGPLERLLMPPLTAWLRRWDTRTAAGVDHFVAISHAVLGRIRDAYGRDAEVVHPPVAVDEFAPSEEREDYYLAVGRLVPYKRFDLAVEAFNSLGRRLIVIGDGEEMERLRRLAGPTVTFLGRQPDAVLRRHYARCRALVFPGIEDFGLVPVEAMASGRPVIAYGEGGALDTVREGETGLFFHRQTPEALAEAVRRFERVEERFRPDRIRTHAERFDRRHFERRFTMMLERWLEGPSAATQAAPRQPRPGRPRPAGRPPAS